MFNYSDNVTRNPFNDWTFRETLAPAAPWEQGFHETFLALVRLY